MRYRHKNKTLQRLDDDPGFRSDYDLAIVKAFRMRMQTIRAAPNETVFYNLKSLHYEKLKGKRSHERSMRLNSQFRLIIEVEKELLGNVIVVVGIEDYH